jgi:hypothetical protein
LKLETTVPPPASLLGGPETSRFLSFGPITRTVQHSTKMLVGGNLTIETTMMIQSLVKNIKNIF